MTKFPHFETNLDNFIPNLKKMITRNEKKIEDLLATSNKTYLSFVKPLEEMEEELEILFTPLSHLNAVDNTQKTQEIYTQALPIITQYATKLSQNVTIYNIYKMIQKEEKEHLTPQQHRVLELNIQNFELSGAHLDEKTKKRLEEINLQKSELANQFSQNLLDATNAFEYIIDNEEDIEGLPHSEIENAKFEKDGKTLYRFTLQMPSYIAYMTYGKNREIRKALYKAYVTRAPENEKIIDQLLALRYEMAQLLGFDNYAQYSLASKMAPDEHSVLNFLNDLLQNAHPQATQECATLQQISPVELESYDTAYYSELLKKEKYSIDEEKYRPYFEQTNVLQGMFNFLEKLFNIKFQKVTTPLWNNHTTAYDIYKANKLTARIYFDLEARESKRGGAWMHNWQSHSISANGQEKLAAAFVVCNFPPASETNPSLLRHDDVVTLFHEMGHAIHHLLSDVTESEVSGVNGVEWDAVEYPSQFLENFAYEPTVLKLFAQHIQTKEVLSDAMIEKLVKSKNFLSAMGMLRQLEFSLFDFMLHTTLYQNTQVQTLLDTIREKTALIPTPSYNKFQNGFAHIFAGGYAAGYYSYKWAEVLSADTFFAVVDEGIFNSNTAQAYHDIVLKNGGSQSMQNLFHTLMHRDPDPKQLLRLNGIHL